MMLSIFQNKNISHICLSNHLQKTINSLFGLTKSYIYDAPGASGPLQYRSSFKEGQVLSSPIINFNVDTVDLLCLESKSR